VSSFKENLIKGLTRDLSEAVNPYSEKLPEDIQPELARGEQEARELRVCFEQMSGVTRSKMCC
jgi:hypothetical protein